MMHPISRRSVLQGAGAGALALFMSSVAPPLAARAQGSLRAIYHMTPPSGWLCDPQRPVTTNGAYQLYYLHSDQNNGHGGWDHATTSDGVAFTHHGTVMPLQPDFPVWSGSVVVDTANTAGFGAGAVVALATQPTGGIRKYQEQYLYWSTDGGFTFTALPDPVIVNTDGRTATTPAELENAEWFRDPKIHWDAARSEWVCVIGRARYAAFYTSHNLIDWQLKRNFDYPNHALGGIECPDLFEMTAGDGTRHWVLGASMDAYDVGLPMTYAYWMGTWNGEEFIADDLTPQWLDWGWDWYGGVTWPSIEAPATRRLAIAWMNNWKYAVRDVPTDASDGYNGQNSIVRELRLEHQSGPLELCHRDHHASRPDGERKRRAAVGRAGLRARTRYRVGCRDERRRLRGAFCERCPPHEHRKVRRGAVRRSRAVGSRRLLARALHAGRGPDRCGSSVGAPADLRRHAERRGVHQWRAHGAVAAGAFLRGRHRHLAVHRRRPRELHRDYDPGVRWGELMTRGTADLAAPKKRGRAMH